jgi:hypothetical protein
MGQGTYDIIHGYIWLMLISDQKINYYGNFNKKRIDSKHLAGTPTGADRNF